MWPTLCSPDTFPGGDVEATEVDRRASISETMAARSRSSALGRLASLARLAFAPAIIGIDGNLGSIDVPCPTEALTTTVRANPSSAGDPGDHFGASRGAGPFRLL